MTESSFQYTLPKFFPRKPDHLALSEHFFSIQGEGPTQGRLSWFVRLQGCNLLCHFSTEHGLEPCDTIPVWSTGRMVPIDELLQEIKERGWYRHLQEGAHVILTGGEPLLRQEELHDLLVRLRIPRVFVEVETNATVIPEVWLDLVVSQYNCSPKLASSNMRTSVRYKKDALHWFARSVKSIFKFVVASPRDLEEIQRDFVGPLWIDPHRVWLMPVSDTREELIANSKMCANLALEHGFNYSSRLQLLVWDKATGV